MFAASCSCTHVCLCVFVLSADSVGWDKGVAYADGQNLARLLMEAPANHITPTAFANTIEEKLAAHAERVTINKRFVLHSSSLTTLTRTAVSQFRQHVYCAMVINRFSRHCGTSVAWY